MGTYNIGTGRQATVTEVHELIAAFLGEVPPPCYAEARTGELQAIALDATRAQRELGWLPEIHLAEGIQRTMEWLRAILDPEPALLEA